MKRICSLFLVVPALLLASLALTGCFADNTIEYDDAARVAFKQGGTDPAVDPRGALPGVPDNEGLIEAEVEDSMRTVNLLVQLVGEQYTDDLTVNYTVNDTLTTAEEGVHYNIADDEVIIPADSSTAFLQVDILGALESNTDQEETVAFSLQGNAGRGVEVAKNYQTFVINIQARSSGTTASLSSAVLDTVGVGSDSIPHRR